MSRDGVDARLDELGLVLAFENGAVVAAQGAGEHGGGIVVVVVVVESRLSGAKMICPDL